jgi:hypothetical protein
VKPKKINVKSTPVPDTKPKVSVRPTNVQISPTSTHATSSSYREPPLTAPPASSSASFPRFGAGSSCPGCHKAVSPMERGVVPGPQGTRWHAGCLVCGGKKETARNALWKPREDRRKGEPGCGKKLDSAAKSDGEGGIWCRECLVSKFCSRWTVAHGKLSVAPSCGDEGLTARIPNAFGACTNAHG